MGYRRVKAAIDNDILLKAACYGLLFDLITVVPSDPHEIGILGVAPFVIRALLPRIKIVGDRASIEAALDQLFKVAELLEPTADEIKFAAELKSGAQICKSKPDSGESQLCAMAISRTSWLATGDKRAIVALQLLLLKMGKISALAGKVICLEQLFLRLVTAKKSVVVREAVCREPHIDRVLAVCFSCHNKSIDIDTWSEGLQSYIAHLRGLANMILA